MVVSTVPPLFMKIASLAIAMLSASVFAFNASGADAAKAVAGKLAPDFKIKDSSGREIVLSELTAKGPVLVRLTCGCLGCDKELPYFQEVHAAYKDKGLISVAIFREPDAKVEAYVKEKKLDMLYAVDSEGQSWKTFGVTTMPSNILIEKGGRIAAVASGCDTSGLIATRLGDKAAQLVGTEKVDVRTKVSPGVTAKPAAKPAIGQE
jgi:peroxiredoxin